MCVLYAYINTYGCNTVYTFIQTILSSNQFNERERERKREKERESKRERLVCGAFKIDSNLCL